MEAKETFNKSEHSAMRWEAKAIKLSATGLSPVELGQIRGEVGVCRRTADPQFQRWRLNDW